MTGQPVYPRTAQTVRDVRILKARGLSMQAIADKLGMSRSTLYRLLDQAPR